MVGYALELILGGHAALQTQTLRGQLGTQKSGRRYIHLKRHGATGSMRML